MAALKKLPARLPVLKTNSTKNDEIDVVIREIAHNIEKAHENIVEVVNDHATVWDTTWTLTNANTLKAFNIQGTSTEAAQVLGTLIGLLVTKGLLG